MSDSLRDQLLGLGFKPAPAPKKPERPVGPRAGGKPHAAPARVRAKSDGGSTPKPHPGHRGKGRSREDIDLAKAYAIRAQREKEERIAAEAARQAEARQRREARAKLAEFVKDKALNDVDADIARHFPYGGKIKRIYVNAAQLRALNSGELGVVQLDGRYVLVTAAVLAEAEAIFPQAIALKVDPDAPPGEDPYSDPQYQVPDDLVW
jgi:uncharacterized protein YaiL (DUF2058 family)